MNYVALGEVGKASEQLKKALDLASADAPLGDKIRTAMQASLKN